MSHPFSINPMRISHEIWDYLMRQKTGDFLIGAPPHKKISCLTRKSHVSCLPYEYNEKKLWDMKFSHETGDMRKYPVSRENLMSHAFSINSKRKSQKTWDYLMRHKIISCLMRKSNVSCFLHKSHEKILWHVKFSHETGDRRFPPGGPPWENLLSHGKI